MRDYVDLGVLANLVSMLRGEVMGALWLVDDTDEAAFYEMCAHPSGRVVPAPQVALSLLDLVAGRGVEGLVAAVRGVLGRATSRDEVFSPDLGDVASVLLVSRGAERVMNDVFGDPWLKACETKVGPVVRRAAWIARLLEEMRGACVHHSPKALDAGQVADVINWKTFLIDWGRANQALCGGALASHAIQGIQAIPPGNVPSGDLLHCDGMDAVMVVALASTFFRPRGIKARQEIDASGLLRMLRVSFELEGLERDAMFWRMRQWERQNRDYPLLRTWRMLDPLNVVWDQRYWEEDLAAILRMLGMTGQIAVLLLDLDNFKDVNARLGHGGGDEAIRLSCSIAKDLIGSHGEVYRRGGDEIVGLAPRLDEVDATALAERVRKRIEAEFQTWGRARGLTSFPTVSIGLVATQGRSIDQVKQLMDDAQRRAKEGGKNCVVLVK